MIENGKKVSIEYTLTLDDGTVADSNVGEDPLTFTQGEGQILPALEKVFVGLALEDTKKVKLTPEEGYGHHDPEAFQKTEPTSIPEELRVVGTTLIARTPEGEEMPVKVTEVSEEHVLIDFNHPLAGQNLNFEVKVVGIE